MAKVPDVPCATCQLWNQETKSFYCDPNKCERLSRWLLRHAGDDADRVNAPVQYVV